MTMARGVIALFVGLLLAARVGAQTPLAGSHVEALPPLPVPDWQTDSATGHVIASPAPPERLVESTWYSRVDYFHWNERIDGGNLLDESGPLWTLGYQRRSGSERFRGEFFTGNVGYASQVDYYGTSEAYTSRTKYMGFKGEYDLLLEPTGWSSVSLLGGIGTRFWIRDLPDDVTPSGTTVWGYQESWWTVYPYLGAERRRVMEGGPEWYWSGRMGVTALTFVHGSSSDDTRLYPRPSLMGSLEAGFRAQHLFLGVFVETFNWRESPEMRGWVQPTSSLVTIGLKTGVNF